MRLRGDIDGSDRIIQECLLQHNADTESTNLAALYLSQAKNHIYRFNFEEAHSQLKKWRPEDIVTQEQFNLLWDQILCAGRALRGQGDFESARALFKACWSMPNLPHHKRFVAGSALADIHCELAMAKMDRESFVELARIRDWIQSELTFISSSGQYRKGYRRLMLSLVEIEILNGRHDAARRCVRQLLGIYAGLESPDITDQLGHIRALISLARLSWTQHDVFERWKEVIDWGLYYKPEDQNVFSCGVVYLCLSCVCAGSGMHDAFSWYRSRAHHILKQQRPQYLIPGIGTYILRQAWEMYERSTNLSSNSF